MFKQYDENSDDDEIVSDFKNYKTWGLEAMIQLYGCDMSAIKDEKVIKQFIIELCDFIDMNRFGEPMIERFGEGELYGYSAVQLIYTSNVVMHFSELDGRVFLNIFSCKEFKPRAAGMFASRYFKAEHMEFLATLRD